MIVVDANVIVYLVIDGPLTAAAQHLAIRDPEWVTCPLWRYELCSAAVTMVRAGVLDEDKAKDAMRAAAQLMEGRERLPLQGEVLDAAIQYDISAYDAQYIALARPNHVKCITSDKPLLRKTTGITVALSAFQDAG